MKSFKQQIQYFSIILFVFSLLLFIYLPSAIAKTSYSMGWEPWSPYQYKNTQGKITGLDIELVTEIMKNVKFSVTYKERPWKRLLYEVEKGKTDLIGGASKTPERKVYAHFTAPYRTESVVLYIRKGEANNYKSFKKLGQLSNIKFKVGVVNGYYYGKNYAKLIKNSKFKANVKPTRADELNIKKLVGGRLDGFLMDPVAATAKLKKLKFLSKVEIHPILIYSDNIYVMFSKKSTSLNIVKIFNKSLKDLKKRGKYDQIIRKYIK
ncbi:MAG: amino acid ABC transporter substrate-binding protein [Desulfobacterales bacterium]|nr:amino acid ABC transporter substrate-binding protein [Desulfobacterales bacterium]MCP4159747.1 amino acid ABC transporter substrate-binding protein [Deltaproteobacteria bacterium]